MSSAKFINSGHGVVGVDLHGLSCLLKIAIYCPISLCVFFWFPQLEDSYVLLIRSLLLQGQPVLDSILLGDPKDIV